MPCATTYNNHGKLSYQTRKLTDISVYKLDAVKAYYLQVSRYIVQYVACSAASIVSVLWAKFC